MTYASLITELRTESGDKGRVAHIDWTGDGTTTTYTMPADTFPILESSYVVKIAGSTKTETTDYTLDKETGTLVFVSAPANNAAVIIDHKAVHATDATWLKIINATIRSFGNDFFKEVTDTSVVTTVGMLSVSAPTNFIEVNEIGYRTSSSEEYQSLSSLENWRYSQDENMLYFGDGTTFTTAGIALKLRGLKKYVLGTATSDTVDVQDRFISLVSKGSQYRYWEHRYPDVIELVSKQTIEGSRTQLQELIMLVDRLKRDFEGERARLKPSKPPRFLPTGLAGRPRP